MKTDSVLYFSVRASINLGDLLRAWQIYTAKYILVPGCLSQVPMCSAAEKKVDLPL